MESGQLLTGVRFRAHGKCLLVGGYSVLYDNQPGLVLKSDSHWFEATTSILERSKESTPTNELKVRVETPQFPSDNIYDLTFEKQTAKEITDQNNFTGLVCAVKSGNIFIDAAVEYSLKAFGEQLVLLLKNKLLKVVVHQSAGFVKQQFTTLVEGQVQFTKPVKEIFNLSYGFNLKFVRKLVNESQDGAS